MHHADMAISNHVYHDRKRKEDRNQICMKQAYGFRDATTVTIKFEIMLERKGEMNYGSKCRINV